MSELARNMDDSEYVKAYDIEEHKIMAMEAEKRKRILNAALNEFSKGYTAANTDVIVKEAGISKGLLFHYFGSKRGLFLFLIKYTLEMMISGYEKVISERCDFLDNLWAVSKWKLDVSLQYPLEYRFQVKAFASLKDVFPEGLPKDVESINSQMMQQIYQRSNHEKSLLKEGVDEEKAQNIIIWTINGLTDSLFRYGDDIEAYKAHRDELVKEIEAYLQTLRRILYRDKENSEYVH